MNNKVAFAFNSVAKLVWFADISAIKRVEKNPTKEINKPVSLSHRNAIDTALDSANMFGEEVEDSADGMSLEFRIRRKSNDEIVPFEEVVPILIKAGFSQNEFYTEWVAG